MITGSYDDIEMKWWILGGYYHEPKFCYLTIFP